MKEIQHRRGGKIHAPYNTNRRKGHHQKATGPNSIPIGNNNDYQKLRIKKQYQKILQSESTDTKPDAALFPKEDEQPKNQPITSVSRQLPFFGQVIEERARRQKERADELARKKQIQEEKERRRKEYYTKREKERKLLLKRTKHNQPVMSNMVDKLLSKLSAR